MVPMVVVTTPWAGLFRSDAFFAPVLLAVGALHSTFSVTARKFIGAVQYRFETIWGQSIVASGPQRLPSFGKFGKFTDCPAFGD
jgi:hypothetical protein